MSGFPGPEVELTTILVVSDVDRARDFWRDVVGAEVYREYGGTSCVLRLAGSWILLVTGGGPTADKPDVTFAAAADRSRVDHAFTMRVVDCMAAYEELRARGATFLTPPVASDWEVRAFFRDPYCHLLEISEARTQS
jgi:catechol 2,3-dioxygenase-like lactoylglutathione lyase family enzyme